MATTAERFVQAGLGEVGKPYTAHRDCSGFTAWCARQAGFWLPEGSVAQYDQGLPIPNHMLHPGDLCFWDTYGPAPGHVAIYTGGERVVHALNERRGIITSHVDAPMGGPRMANRRVIVKEEMVVTDEAKQWWQKFGDWLAEQGLPIPPDFGSATDPSPPPVLASWTAHALAGSSKKLWLPSSIRFRVVLTPKGPNRSGAALRWSGSTQHETGNERLGADAQMHSAWQDAGTPGHPDGKIGVHFYVDDSEIIQKIPVNEQGVHAGDARNQTQTSIERCVDSGSDFPRSQRLSAYLQAGLLRINGWNATEHLYPHNPKPGSGCPVYIGRDWVGFERQVDRAIAEHAQS